MHTTSCKLPALAALLILFAAGSADAQRMHQYRDRISGTAAPSSFDINGDGIPAHYVTFAGWSTLGLINGGILVEYDFTNLGPHPDCPADTVALPIMVSAGSRALTIRGLSLEGGQLLMRADAEASRFCIDPATGGLTMFITGEIIGGLGIFEGATGEYSYEGDGQVLLQDFAGEGDPIPLPFGAFTVETTASFTIP